MFLVKLFVLTPAASKIRFSPYLARLTGISISKYATWGNGHRDIKGTGNGVTKYDLQSEVGGFRGNMTGTCRQSQIGRLLS